MYIITELSTILQQLEHVSYETAGYLHVLLNNIGLRNLVNFLKMVINTLDYRLEYSDIVFEY